MTSAQDPMAAVLARLSGLVGPEPELTSLGAIPEALAEEQLELLLESCQQLIGVATAPALAKAQALLTPITRATRNRSDRRANALLLKGACDVGVGNTDLGVRSLLAAADHRAALAPGERRLASWALANAAIRKRQLRLARELCGSEAGDDSSGGRRLRVLDALLALILRQPLPPLPDPDAWPGWACALRLLSCWRWAETDGLEAAAAQLAEWPADGSLERACAQTLVGQPTPAGQSTCGSPAVLLGRLWCDPEPFAAGVPSRRIDGLCRLLRWLSAPGCLDSQPHESLLDWLQSLSRWELNQRVGPLESALARRFPSHHHHHVLTRLHGRHVADYLTSEAQAQHGIELVTDGVVWMSDVKGYSKVAENSALAELYELLRPIFKVVHETLADRGGMVLDFEGDAILVVFNVFPGQHSPLIGILNGGVRCQSWLKTLNLLFAESDWPELSIGVGLDRGPVALGLLGGLERCELTVLGNAVNQAARIESLTRRLPGTVLAAATLFGARGPELWAQPDGLEVRLRSLGEQTVKNISRPIPIIGIDPLLPGWVDVLPVDMKAPRDPGVIVFTRQGEAGPGVFVSGDRDGLLATLLAQPDWLLTPARGVPASRLEFRVTEALDLDAVAALYAAGEILSGEPRLEALQQLVEAIDHEPAGPQPSDGLLAVFRAHRDRHGRVDGDHRQQRARIEAGLRVIDAAMWLLDSGEAAGLSHVFATRPGWFPQDRGQR